MPIHGKLPRLCQFRNYEKKAMETEVIKLWEKKRVIKSEYEEGQFISPMFLRSKKNGTFRHLQPREIEWIYSLQ